MPPKMAEQIQLGRNLAYFDEKQARASLGSFDEMASGLLVRAGRKTE
jgi:hypothetical protein